MVGCGRLTPVAATTCILFRTNDVSQPADGGLPFPALGFLVVMHRDWEHGGFGLG